jgi:hypothetical protein
VRQSHPLVTLPRTSYQSIHSENDGSSAQSGSVGRNHEAQIDPALFSTARDVEKTEGRRDLPEDRDLIALECVAE